MILAIVDSINGVPIRLTEARWEHILTNHLELSDSDMDLILDAVQHPEYILSGYRGSMIAVAILGRSRYLHVVYREVNRDDGFIITAGIRPKMRKENILWRR
jgi:hypothetical protein